MLGHKHSSITTSPILMWSSAVASSGRTPYVHGALAEAHRIGAKTIFLCCTPPADKLKAFVGPLHRAGCRSGDYHWLNPAKSWYSDEVGAKHAYHRLNDPDREGV